LALIGNHSVLNKSHAFFTNGTSTAGAYAANTKSNWTGPSVLSARRINLAPRSSIPEGYNLGEAYLGPIKSGGLATGLRILGESSLTATAITARLSTASLAGSASVTAGLSVITPGASALTGVATLTAAAAAVSSVAASISGAASLSANLSALVPLAAALTGAASVAANLKGKGSLAAEIDIGAGTELSPLSLSQELLDNQEIEIGYSLREALRLVLASLAGKVSGAGTATITIRSATDGTNRIVATVDANGNRSAVTHDTSDE